MMSIAKLKSGGEAANYYLHLVNAAYYTEGGEPAGRWVGAGASNFGIAGEVEPTQLINLMQGFHPITGAQLGQAQGKHSSGVDACFSAPKSVSIVWALGDKELQDKIDMAQQQAAEKAVAYLEEQAITRRGKGGLIHEKPKGIVASTFRHSTSREEDPQLHSHCIIVNLCSRSDGTFGTLETKPFFQHKMTAGAIYRAELADGLRDIGFELDVDGKDNFKVVGVSVQVCKQFSKRHNDIDKYLIENGLKDAKSAAIAALKTRSSKDEVCFGDKIEDWKVEAAPFNINAASIEALRTFKTVEPSPPTIDEILFELTERTSTFREQDIKRIIAIKGQTVVFDRDALFKEICDSPELVRLTSFTDGQKRFTSQEMRELEQGIVAKALAGKDSTKHHVNDELIEAGIAKVEAKNGFFLNAEQREAVHHLAKTGNVACVEGMAGTGKTTMLEVARVVFESDGKKVIGCSLAGKAAAGLQEGAGIESGTIHSLLRKLEKGTVVFDEKTVVVIDEAGMVGSRLYAQLLEKIDVAGGKLINIGDWKQLQAIDSGNMFKQITKTVGSVELVEIRRQKESWLKEAVHDLAAGNAEKALKAFDDNNCIKVADGRGAAIEQMVKAWHGDKTDVKEKLMLAATGFETRILNEAARELLKKDGTLISETATVIQCADENEREFCVGDRILFLKNDNGLEVKNGTLGFIEKIAFDKEGIPQFTVKCDDQKVKTFDLETYSDLAHGLCVSVHKSQGATVDKAYVLTNANMGDREWSYVAGSRSRYDTNIFTTKDEYAEMAAKMGRSNQKDSSLDYEVLPQSKEQENSIKTAENARQNASILPKSTKSFEELFDSFAELLGTDKKIEIKAQPVIPNAPSIPKIRSEIRL
jgi:Ti-type conjugative transfer relaxase TraA